LIIQAETVVVPSQAVSDSFPKWLLMDDTKLRVAENFTRMNFETQIREPQTPFHVVCPAAYFPNKGQEVLLRAAASLRDAGVNFRVSFYGDGDASELKRLRKISRNLRLSVQVTFAGFAPKEEVFSTASLIVLPSVSQEAYGLTLIEAMSLGIPVLASRVGGIPELFRPSESRALFSPGNSSELAEKIWNLVNNPELLRIESQRMRALFTERHHKASATENLLIALGLGHAPY